MDEVLYISNKKKKTLARAEEQKQFLEEKRIKKITEDWEAAQIKAAGIQSALDYAVEQYTQHKDELDEQVQKEVEEQIKLRQEEIKEFIMTEKDKYLEAMGIQAD